MGRPVRTLTENEPPNVGKYNLKNDLREGSMKTEAATLDSPHRFSCRTLFRQVTRKYDPAGDRRYFVYRTRISAFDVSHSPPSFKVRF